VLAGVLVVISVTAPEIMSENKFLEGFINQEILSIMAVIMTISIATIATIHIWFNELEAKHETRVFGGARREINQSAFYFVFLFVAQLVCLIVRSLHIFADNETAISLFNGASLLLLLLSVITLLDVLGVVRALTPND
jgi:magnesium-transporting ATPase (P-type)